MKIDEKAVKTCLKLGFEDAFIDNNGDLIAYFPGEDKSFIAREWGDGVKAWVVVGKYPMWSPKQITKEVKSGGYKFVSLFDTVRTAAVLALANPHY